MASPAWKPVADDPASKWTPVEEHPLDTASRLIKEWWNSGPAGALKGTAAAIRDPKAVVSGALDQNSELLKRAKDAYGKGDYIGAAAHTLNYALNGIPGLGYSLDDAGTDFKNGDIAAGTGKTLGLATNMMLGAKMPQILDAATDAKLPTLPSAEAVKKVLGVAKDVYHVTHSANPITKGMAVKSLIDKMRSSAQGAPVVAPEAAGAIGGTQVASLPESPRIALVSGYTSRPEVIASEHGLLPTLDRSQFFREFSPEHAPDALQPTVAPAPASTPVPADMSVLSQADDLESLLQRSIEMARARKGSPATAPIVSPANEPLNAQLQQEAEAQAVSIENAARTRKALKIGKVLQEHGIDPESLTTPEQWKMAHEAAGVPLNAKDPSKTIQAVKELTSMGAQ